MWSNNSKFVNRLKRLYFILDHILNFVALLGNSLSNLLSFVLEKRILVNFIKSDGQKTIKWKKWVKQKNLGVIFRKCILECVLSVAF